MTNQMNNPIELPDLDKLEALARAAESCIFGKAVAEFRYAANPVVVLALIALARRVQPEGEIPQAAAHRAVIEEAAQVLESAAAHNRAKGRTVLERTQQNRANRLRAILSNSSSAKDAP